MNPSHLKNFLAKFEQLYNDLPPETKSSFFPSQDEPKILAGQQTPDTCHSEDSKFPSLVSIDAVNSENIFVSPVSSITSLSMNDIDNK